MGCCPRTYWRPCRDYSNKGGCFLRKLLLLLLPLWLCGCGPAQVEPGLELRQRILENGCAFRAEITADYGDSLSRFTLDCQGNPDGSLLFTVAAPEGIGGIRGTLASGTGKLQYEDKALGFPLVAEKLLSPVSAPWVFYRGLRSGNLLSSGKEGALTRLTLDDSFQEDALRLDVWLDEEGNPCRCYISWANQSYLSLNIENFRTLSQDDA